MAGLAAAQAASGLRAAIARPAGAMPGPGDCSEGICGRQLRYRPRRRLQRGRIRRRLTAGCACAENGERQAKNRRQQSPRPARMGPVIIITRGFRPKSRRIQAVDSGLSRSAACASRMVRNTAMPDALDLLKTRRSIKPIEFKQPGPTAAELDTLLTVASRVPDHGKLTPWRFIVFEGDGPARCRREDRGGFSREPSGCDARSDRRSSASGSPARRWSSRS